MNTHRILYTATLRRNACNQGMLNYASHVQAVKLKHQGGFNTDKQTAEGWYGWDRK